MISGIRWVAYRQHDQILLTKSYMVLTRRNRYAIFIYLFGPHFHCFVFSMVNSNYVDLINIK